MLEKNAKKSRGFILLDHVKGSNVTFRVYHKKAQKLVNKKQANGETVTQEECNACFTDYDITHTDLEVKIVGHASFIEKGKDRLLDNDFRQLGRPPRSDIPTKKQLKQYRKVKESTVITGVRDGKPYIEPLPGGNVKKQKRLIEKLKAAK